MVTHLSDSFTRHHLPVSYTHLDSVAEKSFADFENYVRRFEDLLYAEDKDWDQISSMIDVDSFVAFYLLEEFSENPDSCRTSLYMYPVSYTHLDVYKRQVLRLRKPLLFPAVW